MIVMEIMNIYSTPLIKKIHKAMEKDQRHPQFYELFQTAPDLFQKCIVLIQFLEIHTELRKCINHDNVQNVFEGVIFHVYPEYSFTLVANEVRKVVFLLKQDFLYFNLERHARKKCFFI